MQTGVTWWSEQFWINVTTTSLGILASVGLAVGLYYLKRKHDRQDEAARAEADKQTRLREELLALMRSYRDLPHTCRSKMERDAFKITVAIAAARMTDYRLLIEDQAIAGFCNTVKEALFATQAKGYANEQEYRACVNQYIGLTVEATAQLAAYLKAGKPFNAEAIAANIEDPTSPVSVEP